MTVSLSYPDKYRLWSDLVRGNREHLFVPTEETPRLGATIAIEVAVAHLNLPLTLQGEVVGRRPASARFPAGVYVAFTAEAVERCMRYLGLGTIPATERRSRRAIRVHAALPVRFTEPPDAASGVTKNLSETGLFLSAALELVPSQRIGIALELPTGTLRLTGDVVWADAAQQAYGLDFVAPSEDELTALRAYIDAARAAERHGQGPRPAPLLVADDDPEILRLVRTALEKSGFEVFQASSGSEALRLSRQLLPALVLLDILMPGIDGAEICKAMRGDAELVEVPIIFVSALAPEVLHQVAAEAGASDYLSKPLHLRDLLDLVETYTRRS